MCVGGGQRNLRGRSEAMGEEQSEGRDTQKATLLKPPSLSTCEILHFGAHSQAQEKINEANMWNWRYPRTSLS